jgi:hypothetical protein
MDLLRDSNSTQSARRRALALGEPGRNCTSDCDISCNALIARSLIELAQQFFIDINTHIH